MLLLCPSPGDARLIHSKRYTQCVNPVADIYCLDPPRNHALILLFLIGAMYDTLNPITFGMHAFTFVLLGICVDQFRKPFEVDSIVAKLLTIGVANLIFSLIQLLVFGLAYGFGGNLLSLSLGAFFYNLIISFVVFWSMQLISKLRLSIAHD